MMDSTTTVVVVFLWIIIGGGVGAYLGFLKNRQTEGLVFGSLFGVIGWFVVLLMPEGETPNNDMPDWVDGVSIESANRIPTCPVCSKKGLMGRNDDGSTYYQCPSCKERILELKPLKFQTENCPLCQKPGKPRQDERGEAYFVCGTCTK